MNLTAEDGRNQDREDPRPSFAEFVKEWYVLVDAVAHAKFADPNQADDVAQQTWIKAARAFDRGVRPENPQVWLLTILRHEVAEMHRRPSPPSLLAEPSCSPPPDPLERKEEADRVRQVLREVPVEDRELLILRYIENRPAAELRRRFGLSRSGLKKRLGRARERFVGIFRLPSE